MIGYYVINNRVGVLKLSQKKSFIYPILFILIIYVIVFSIMKDLTVLSHNSYFDFAVYLEIFNNFANGKGLFTSMQENCVGGTGNWLSAHFTPFAYIYGYLFKIWPSFHMVNWSMTVFLSSSALILYLLAKKEIGNFCAFCISVTLLLNPTFQYITLYEFEFLRFIIPIGIITIGMVILNASGLWIITFCFLSLLVREDVAMFVIGIGIYIYIIKKRRMLGAFIISSAIIYFILIVNYVMPSLRLGGNGIHVAAASFQYFGSNLQELFLNILHHPVKFLAYIDPGYKIVNIIMYMLPFSFVPAVSLDVLIICLPLFLFLSFGVHMTYISYFIYYISPIIATLAWATTLGFQRISNYVNESLKFAKYLHLTFPITKEKIAFAVLCGSFACSIYFGPSPISIQFWNRDFILAPFRTTTFYISRYRYSPHDELLRKAAMLIPENASVAAEEFLLNDVYKCRSIKTFNSDSAEGVDYIFLDKSRAFGIRKGNDPRYYDCINSGPDIFDEIYSNDGIYLYRKNGKS